MRGLLGLHYPLWNRFRLNKGLCPYSSLGAYSCHSFSIPWACWPCWPIEPITSFLGLLRPTFFIFSDCSSYGPTAYYSYHAGSLGLLPLFLGFLGPIISSLPLILPIGPLAIIPAMLVHWACYLFSCATRPSNFIFSSYSSHEPVSCYSCHVGPLGLLPLFLGFSSPVTSSLPLILPMCPLVVVMLTHWAY